MTAFGYRGYGLDLVSEIELPEYLPAAVSEAPDIRIVLDSSLHDLWQQATGGAELPGGAVVASPRGGHMFRAGPIAVYHVQDGREIRIAPGTEGDPGLLRLYTVGSAIGLALHQRGAFVLHGATVARGGQARIIVGDSGAGKSTLASQLGRAGFTVFGDDTMAVWDAPDGRGKWLWPGSRVFKLWSESLDVLGVSAETLEPIGNRSDKFYVPNPLPPAGEGAELVEILVLEVGDGAPRIERVDGLQALEAVARNTYRPEYVGLMGREAAHFRQCCALAGAVPVSRLVRPWDLARIGETVDLMLGHWSADEVSGSGIRRPAQ